MVYCTKCGVKNEEDAKTCTSCGQSLSPVQGRSKRAHNDECFGPRRDMEEECFGLPRGGAVFTVLIGVAVVMIGVVYLLGQYYGWSVDVWQSFGPSIIIIIGILVVVGALYRARGR
jgi:uncharacterized membrane protein YvbJ